MNPPRLNQKTLCITVQYHKSFRGRGCGGGDPFAKGSLPHKAFHRNITLRYITSLRRIILWRGVLRGFAVQAQAGQSCGLLLTFARAQGLA